MDGFWGSVKKPLYVLAPLANVTDVAFRAIIARYSKPYGPSAMFTEFVSADGLVRGNRDVLLKDLLFEENERPIVAQFFTSNPDMMREAAELARDLGFDGIDINMGCPDRTVEKQGAGAALIKNPSLALRLIEEARHGARGLPVSVKTRLGYNSDVLEEWLPVLLSVEPAAISIHARTRKEMSKVSAHWERISRAVSLRDASGSRTLIIGNGDVQDLQDAREKIAQSGADGVMLGRAIFGKPWLFDEKRNPSVSERLEIALEHTELFEQFLGGIKSFSIMKKHFKAYVEGFPGAKELRAKLMETQNATEVQKVIEEYLGGILQEP